MRAVEPVGTGKRRVTEVVGVGDEVDVFHRSDCARIRIRNDRVDALHARQRAIQLSGEFHLQGVVDGTADGEEHLIGTDIRIDSAEGGARVRRAAEQIGGKATVVRVARVEAVAGVVEDTGSGGDGAVNGNRVGAGAAAESGVRCGDCI